jgi:hypothetical protein
MTSTGAGAEAGGAEAPNPKLKGKPDLGPTAEAALGVGEALDGGACLSPYTNTLDWYDSVPSVGFKKENLY